MITSITKTLSICLLACFIMIACKKKTAVSIPTLTTTGVTGITANTAMSGGTIADNGGAQITASGICWSKTSNTPTIVNDTTKGSTASGSFTAMLKNLDPSSTYYVRAYAINAVGIGYGNVVTFASANAGPVASAVTITGTAEVNKVLTVTYTYSDAEGDAQSGTTFQWYAANDAAGTGEIAISGATASTYTLKDAEQGKYIRVGVTPKAATGTTTGVEVKSSFLGAVGEATTVTFTYNGATVTYGILTSALTGRKWMDRNLGAPAVPTAWNDWANYGDLFQWGRLADGHQRVNRASTTATTTGVNGTTSTQSTGDNPGHSLFINGSSNWRNPENINLWQGINGVNNPCPAGWRIPTQAEWAAENLELLPDAYTKLKITSSGHRKAFDGLFSNTTVRGAYWSSTPITSGPTTGTSVSFWFTTVSVGGAQTYDERATGNACRCIKN